MLKSTIIFIFLLDNIISLACVCGPFKKITKKEDLVRYEFVAYVRITSIAKSKLRILNENDIYYEAFFDLKELYKGDSTGSILVSGDIDLGITDAACGIKLSKNEEWVVFGYREKDNTLRTGYCSHTAMYKNAEGERNWLYGIVINEINILRKIYQIPEPTKPTPEGTIRYYYPNGQVEIIENYKDGKLDGKRLRYFSNGQLMSDEFFKNGLQTGKAIWYSKRGTMQRDYNYENNHPIDTCLIYGVNAKVCYKRIFDKSGEMIIDYQYSYDGLLKQTYEQRSYKK